MIQTLLSQPPAPGRAFMLSTKAWKRRAWSQRRLCPCTPDPRVPLHAHVCVSLACAKHRWQRGRCVSRAHTPPRALCASLPVLCRHRGACSPRPLWLLPAAAPLPHAALHFPLLSNAHGSPDTCSPLPRSSSRSGSHLCPCKARLGAVNQGCGPEPEG